jgi:hypothetical protein
LGLSRVILCLLCFKDGFDLSYRPIVSWAAQNERLRYWWREGGMQLAALVFDFSGPSYAPSRSHLTCELAMSWTYHDLQNIGI